jgi:CHAT domain
VSLSAIRRQLGADESLIEFVLDTNKSYALQVSLGGLEVHELPGRSQIDRLVNQFLSGVRNNRESGDLAKMLYSRVLSPAMAKRTTSIIIVPDGSLHLLPFGALMDGGGATINTRLTATSVPSATVDFTLKTAAPSTAATRPFLGVAYSPPRSAPVQVSSNTRGVFDLGKLELRPLQSAREEIGEAAKVLGQDSVTRPGSCPRIILLHKRLRGMPVSYLKHGTPEWIRTTDLLLRRQTLYPAELRAHIQPHLIVSSGGQERQTAS